MPETVGEEVAREAPESAQLARVLGKVFWRLIPFMFVLYIMSYLDRINVSFAVLQMKDALNFTDLIFGFGSGIFFLGYCVFGIPSNLMVERLGARRWRAFV
jgi:ACS family tartrate transporter-like MFS transporter